MRLGVRSRSCSGARWYDDWVDEMLLLQSCPDARGELESFANDTFELCIVRIGGRAVGGVPFWMALVRVEAFGVDAARAGDSGGVGEKDCCDNREGGA